MDSLILSDINNTIEMNKIPYVVGKPFRQYGKLYKFTNESLANAFKLYDLNHKKVLTIASSGDHFLNAAFKGASVIDTFDINRLTNYYQEYKKATVKALTNDEFIKFFYFEDDTISSYVYKKIEAYLSEPAKNFFQNIIKKMSQSELNDLFYKCNDLYLYNNAYIHSIDNYEILKNKLLSVKGTFIESEIRELSNKLTTTYDLIYLSNIYSYIDICFEEFFSTVLNTLIPYLTPTGEIMYYYRWIMPDERVEEKAIGPYYKTKIVTRGDNRIDYLYTYKKTVNYH